MKTVVICGSRRFKLEIRKFAADLKVEGVMVFEPFLHSGGDEWQKLSKDYQESILLGLTHDRFYKIRMADVVFLYNEGGYAGPSTTLELGCAVVLGKPVCALSDQDPELCRMVLCRGFFANARDFLPLLR